MSHYVIVDAGGPGELECKVQDFVDADASWQPLGGAFVRDRLWFQTLYRRPFWGRRLLTFGRNLARRFLANIRRLPDRNGKENYNDRSHQSTYPGGELSPRRGSQPGRH